MVFLGVIVTGGLLISAIWLFIVRFSAETSRKAMMLKGALLGCAATLAILCVVPKDYLKESAIRIALAILVGILVAAAVALPN